MIKGTLWSVGSIPYESYYGSDWKLPHSSKPRSSPNSVSFSPPITDEVMRRGSGSDHGYQSQSDSISDNKNIRSSFEDRYFDHSSSSENSEVSEEEESESDYEIQEQRRVPAAKLKKSNEGSNGLDLIVSELRNAINNVAMDLRKEIRDAQLGKTSSKSSYAY